RLWKFGMAAQRSVAHPHRRGLTMQPAINGVWRRSRAWPVAESQCGASRGAERAALTLPVGGKLFFWPVARIVGGAQRQEGEGGGVIAPLAGGVLGGVIYRWLSDEPRGQVIGTSA